MAEIQRDVMEMDVLFVGAGPASLAGAYHLANLIKKHNDAIESGTKQGQKIQLENGIGILEKGKNVGDHMLSGAVMDPSGIKELIPDFLEKGFPFECEVTGESVYLLTEKGKFKFPMLPPTLQNHGNYICSLNKVAAWLADQIGKEFGDSVNIFPEFP
ncbi:electron transfer flavoprotein-ubiquinone oxidoreductase, partial [bacterium]|nr:electron transfer flavoprotein-ubiquinone oxidoreductase [bacterium]